VSVVVNGRPLVDVDGQPFDGGPGNVLVDEMKLADVLVTTVVTPRRCTVRERTGQRHRCHDDTISATWRM